MTSSDVPADIAPTAQHRSGVLHGLKISIPLVIGYVPVAFAFGVVGRLSGLPDWATVGMSLFVYGGASQFAALPLLATGNLASIVTTTLIINLRHLLLAGSISPKLRGFNTGEMTWFSLELTDEAFALHDAEYRNRASRPKSEIFTANGVVHLSWVIGTVLGVALGSVIPDPKSLGLDFALTAMFIAILFIDVMKTRHDFLIAAIGGSIAVAVTLIGARTWATVVAAVVAATIGWLLQVRNIPKETQK